MRSALCCLLLLLAACDGSEKEKKARKDSQTSEIKKAVEAVQRASEGASKESEVRNRLSPALKFLPAGSTLKDVRIPRYDKNERRAALLRAEVLKVISEQHVTSDNIELRLFSKGDREVLRVHMGAAEYFVDSGLLEAKEILTVTGEQVQARGTGGFFHLDSRQGFVQGPVSTTLRRKREPAKKAGETPAEPAPKPAPRPNLAEIVPVFVEPQALTRTELAEIDALLRSRSKSVLADRAPTRKFLISGEQASAAAEVGLRSFTNQIGRGTLLTPVSNGTPIPPREVRTPLGKDELHVTSQGGMYIGVEHGHLEYLRDVVVTEARFTMQCSEHLLIVREPKADQPADEEGGKDPADASPDQLLNTEDFSDVKTIIATGGVRVERTDPSGKQPPIIITGETAIVDVMTGDMVLQGGSPSIRQGVNLLRADEPDLYLRYYANGNVFADKGRWTTVGDLASLKTIKDHDDDDGKQDDAKEGTGEPVADGKAEEKEKENVAAAVPQTITVTCTGGMYFDAREGQLVYLENVEVSEPRFRMKCGKELKAFLRRNPVATAEGVNGLEAFSDVDYLVASGAVSVERTDPKGAIPPATATAEHAILNAGNGDIILRGGTPTIRQGGNSLEAGSPDLYLRFYQNGSLFTEPGKWTTAGDLANLRTKPGAPRKAAQLITVTSQGGLYFDSVQGHIVYLEDVVVVEPRFRMTCKSEMKIILQERVAKPGERLEGPEAFSDVKAIIARGGVAVLRRDPKGKADPITATAQTAVYDAESGDIVLREGRPTIRQGKSYAKAEEDGLYIRFYSDGSLVAEDGKWDMNFEIKDFEALRMQQERPKGN